MNKRRYHRKPEIVWAYRLQKDIVDVDTELPIIKMGDYVVTDEGGNIIATYPEKEFLEKYEPAY